MVYLGIEPGACGALKDYGSHTLPFGHVSRDQMLLNETVYKLKDLRIIKFSLTEEFREI